jgi:hypothetical protein
MRFVVLESKRRTPMKNTLKATAGIVLLAAFGGIGSARGATCSNASLSGTYGFVHGGTDSGTPVIGLSQATFDPTTGTYTGEVTENTDGAVITESLAGTYAVAPNCTVTASVRVGSHPAINVSFVLTPTGFLFLFQKPGATSSGFGVKQGSAACTNAGVEGSFGFQTTGAFLAGAPATGPVAFIGELKLTVDPSGAGVIRGHIAGSEDGTILTFAEEPVSGSYTVGTDCRGTATITPKGQPEMNFSFVVVDCGNEMLVLETDADTVVSGTLVKGDERGANP